MSEPVKVFICDCCNRVVARMNGDGKLILVTRHDGERHETTIAGHWALTTPPERDTVIPTE